MGNEDVSILAAHVLAAGFSEQLSLWVGIVVGLIAIAAGIGTIFSARRRATDRAKAELDAAFERGVRSRDDEFALIRSQRDDARRDRDAAERGAEDARRNEADARRTLAMMQRPIADYRLDPDPPHRPRPGDQ